MKVVFLLMVAPLLCWGNSERVCVSKKGNECQFPFTYKGRSFDQCTTYNSENKEPWCKTTDGRYEDCEAYCPGAACYDESYGDFRDHGATFPKDCNTCTCFAGSIGCTYIGCDVTCFDEVGGVLRDEGESWERDCNTCNCNGGNIGCTLALCPPKPSTCECLKVDNAGVTLDPFDSPETTCSQDPTVGNVDLFCYVDCDSNCSDKKPARGRGKCFSEIACAYYNNITFGIIPGQG